MFGLFTKNLDAMGKSTKKARSLFEIDNLTKIEKQDLQKILGGSQKGNENKKGKNLFGLSFLSPCEGDLPQ